MTFLLLIFFVWKILLLAQTFLVLVDNVALNPGPVRHPCTVYICLPGLYQLACQSVWMLFKMDPCQLCQYLRHCHLRLFLELPMNDSYDNTPPVSFKYSDHNV